MKKIFFTLLFVFSFITIHAQKVKVNDTTYKVKGKSIYLKGENVTHTLDKETSKYIFDKATSIQDVIDAELIADKQKEEAKKRKKAEKKRKKAEKELKKIAIKIKKKNKLENSIRKQESQLKKAQEKYKKLQNRNKLTSEDELKWQKKIEKINLNIKKSNKKLRNF